MNVKQNNSQNDFVGIHDFEISCRVGCSAEERSFPQILSLDIKMFLPLKKASSHDHISQTVNYAEVIEKIKNNLGEKEFSLIETIAEETAQLILTYFEITSTSVTVSKKAFAGVGRVAAHVWREKSNGNSTKKKKSSRQPK